MSTHQTVVVELGCTRIKVGFAGESRPRRVISCNDESGALGIDDGICTSSCTWNNFYKYLSSTTDPSAKGDNIHPSATSSYEWEKTLYPLFTYILTSVLFIQRPSRHRILVLMNDIFPPRHLREALIRVLLDYLNLGAVLLLNGGGFGSMQYLLEGMNLSGDPSMTQMPKAFLLVDVGTNEARIGASVPGSSVLIETYQVIPAGYDAFLRQILLLYREEGESWTEKATLEDVDVIVQAWMSASDVNTATFPVELPLLAKQITELSESSQMSSSVQISVQPLLDAFRQVFLDYTQPTSLVHAILNSVLSCPIDFRKVALQNIVLIGGGSVALRSFGEGLKVEVENAIKAACGVSVDSESQIMEEEKKDDGMEVSSIAQGRFRSLKAAVEGNNGVQIKYPDPFAADVASWVGASVMGKLRLSNEDWISVDSDTRNTNRLRR